VAGSIWLHAIVNARPLSRSSDDQTALAASLWRRFRFHARRFRHDVRAPSHPELLDYLASRFVEEGWSIKKMHRLIMLSSVIRGQCQQSALRPTDPGKPPPLAANSAIGSNSRPCATRSWPLAARSTQIRFGAQSIWRPNPIRRAALSTDTSIVRMFQTS